MNKITKILIAVALILGLCVWGVSDAMYAAPKRYTLRTEELSSPDIPEQLNDMSILFFSDLDYGTFMDEQRLTKLINKINGLAPDVIIFGGDLYDTDASASEESNQILSNAFKDIHAVYGKYAVYGDSDDRSADMISTVNAIYNASDFEVLNNQAVNLHKQSSSSIALIGIDNSVNGKPDISTVYSTVSRDTYVLTVCHTPDTALSVPADITNYFLAGHSHGGQVYYFFGALYQPAGAKEYFRGAHTIANEFTLDITNGVGTTIKDVRLLSDAEVVLYKLKNTTDDTTTKTQTSTPTAVSTASAETSTSSAVAQ